MRPGCLGAKMMRIFSRLSFRTKLNLAISVVVLVFGLLSLVLVSRIASQSMLGEIKKRGLSLAWNLAARTTDPLLALDFLRLKNVVDEVKDSSDDIVYAFVQDKNGQVLSHTFKSGFPVELRQANLLGEEEKQRVQLLDTGEERIYDFALPVEIGPNRLGTVRVGLSQAKAQATVQSLVVTVFNITLIAGLAALVMGTLFATTVTRRLNKLRSSAEEMVKGNLDLQTGPLLPRNCWEILDCQRSDCPAFGDRRRRCWMLNSTFCHDSHGVSLQEDNGKTCELCPVYLDYHGDEIQSLAESFDVMAFSLRLHLEGMHEAQRHLARQQQLLKTILDVTPDLVSLQDRHLVYRAVNPAFCRFLGVSEDTLLGQDSSQVHQVLQDPEGLAEDHQVIDTGVPVSKEVHLSQGQEEHWFHVVKMPVYDESQVAGLLFTARDITELKRYQEKLLQSVKMEELGKLAGGVAHEINTPLSIILGYSQMLLEDFPQDTESHEYLTIVERQAQICRRIVSDLLSFSRHMESRAEEMDLNRSLAEVLQWLEPIFRQNWVEVRTSFDAGIPTMIGDLEKLKQVWLNLLNNAYESIGQHGTIWVKTELCPETRQVTVAVADTGDGINPEDLEKIFDPFYSTKAPGGGTGLGLSVSFGIIQEHQGEIQALSPVPAEYREQMGTAGQTSGPGAFFLVKLPLARQTAMERSAEPGPFPLAASPGR